jgi:hypothetical protein
MKRALGLLMTLMLLGAGVVAAADFPIPTRPALPAGAGWRLIYEQLPADRDFAYRVAVATDDDGYRRLWDDVAGLTGFAPYVDLNAHVVALFADGISSCTTGVSFDGLVIDTGRRIVHADIRRTATCPNLDLAGSAVFLVAIARDGLPELPFTLQLDREQLCSGCPDSVVVDL